jgi:hypothetical protein
LRRRKSRAGEVGDPVYRVYEAAEVGWNESRVPGVGLGETR